jgi:hypothetical protein
LTEKNVFDSIRDFLSLFAAIVCGTALRQFQLRSLFRSALGRQCHTVCHSAKSSARVNVEHQVEFADPAFFDGCRDSGRAEQDDFSAWAKSSETINYTDCGESATDLKPLNCNPLQKSS